MKSLNKLCSMAQMPNFQIFIFEKTIKNDGIYFTSSEQFFQYTKAKMFNDMDAMNAILSTDNPLTQKRTKITGYKEQEWSKISLQITKEGVRMKFDNDPNLREYLINTGEKLLIEANPKDDFWGI